MGVGVGGSWGENGNGIKVHWGSDGSGDGNTRQ